MLRVPDRREAVKDETIERLLQLWGLIERDRRYIKLPNWDKRRKPSRRELPRLSIRTWNNAPDWYAMMNIYWAISSWMLHLPKTKTFQTYYSRIDILLMALRLDDYMKAAHNAELRYFIERLRRLALAIVDAIDEEEAET